MGTPVSEIVLSKDRERILGSLYKGKTIPAAKINDSKYEFLLYYSLIYCNNGKYRISERGINYVNLHKKDDSRFVVSIVISVAALIISIISLFT